MGDDSDLIVTNGNNHIKIISNNEKNSNGLNGHHHHNGNNGAAAVKEVPDDQFQPPDGGFRAWIILISAFLCNGVIFGIINTYGIIYLKLQEQMKAHGDEEASSKAG